MQFFHLTTADRLDDILSNGLDPLKSASSLQAIFLAGSAMTAQNYEGMKDDPTRLLSIDLPKAFCEQHLGPDNYELRDLLEDLNESELAAHGLSPDSRAQDCSWRQSLAICDQVACPVLIPPHCINPVMPELVLPSLPEIVDVLSQHPLMGLKEKVKRAFMVGSFAKEHLGVGSTRPQSDIDVLLEVKARPGETELEMTDRYRRKLQNHFVRHNIRTKADGLHPQWCQRRIDVYFTYNADGNPLPMVQLPLLSLVKTQRAKKRLRP